MPRKAVIEPEKSIPLTDDEFWAMFVGDLAQATSHVILHAPFLHDSRIEFLGSFARGFIDRGGTICVFLQKKTGWDWNSGWTGSQMEDLQSFQLRCELLDAMGLHLNLKRKVHQKIAIIDGKVLYEGSLNMLSHADNGENMRRFATKADVDVMTLKHGLDLCAICRRALLKHGSGPSDGSQLERIGASLKKHRLARGLSQKKVAIAAGISRFGYAQIEKGKNCSLASYLKILGALELSCLNVPLRDIQYVASFQEKLEISKIQERPDLALLRKGDGVYREEPEVFRAKAIFAKENGDGASANRASE